ncbi:MAG: ATP-binding protein [Phycisphaerales bacterium]
MPPRPRHLATRHVTESRILLASPATAPSRGSWWSQLPTHNQVLVVFGFAAIGCVAFAAGDLMLGARTVPSDLIHPIVVGAGVILAIVVGSIVFQIRKQDMREKAVAESKRELEQILAAATRVAVISTDANGTIRQFNSGAVWMLGYDPANVIGRSSPTTFHLDAEIARRAQEIERVTKRRPEGFEVLVADVGAQEPIERQWTLRCRDGGSIQASVTATALQDAAGRTTGFLFIARDVTRELNAIKGLQEAKRIAEEANETKSQFVANISHEIRTPMTAILGYADLLEDEALDPTVRLEHVRTIRRNGDHLLAIINDILDMERINSGKLPIEIADTPLPELVREVVDLMRVRANAKGLSIEVRAESGVPRRLRTDAMRVRQILVNLVGNAIKFTEEGGIVLTFLEQEGAGGRALCIQVADSGIGIRAEQVDRLFEPFTQADSTSTRRHGGSGLGLAISRRLAVLLGGDLKCRSIPGEGSVFTLSLPLEGASQFAAPRTLELPPSHASQAPTDSTRSTTPSTSAAALAPPTFPIRETATASEDGRPMLANAAPLEGEPKPAPHPRRRGLEALLDGLIEDGGSNPAGRREEASAVPIAPPRRLPTTPSRSSTELEGCRVLLVEDAVDTRRLLSLHLGRAGAEVVCCEDGQQAVDRLVREGMDRACQVVLMDMQMPGLDGYEATRQLRALGFRRPIVALTAHASTTDREKCLACGCDDYASKPIDAKALVALCLRWRPDRIRRAA